MAFYQNKVICAALLLCLAAKNKAMLSEEMFSVRPSNSSFNEGEFAYLECLRKNSEIEISWEKENKTLQSSKLISIMESGYIFFHKVIYENSGWYTCVARSLATGATQKASALLQVNRVQKVEEICGKARATDILNTTLLPRLASGHDTIKGEHPWQVLLMKHDNLYSSGVLLNERWIATAAHCLFDELKEGNRRNIRNFTIKLGKYAFMDYEDEEFAIPVRHQSALIFHPHFKSEGWINDIALIRLNDPVRFTDYIIPICLGDRELGEKLLKPDLTERNVKLGVVTGWGSSSFSRFDLSNVLQAIRIPVVGPEKCVSSTGGKVPDSSFCAGYGRKGSEDACLGDSGAPFIMKHNDRWYLMGLVSGGLRCSEENEYGYYTRVTDFTEWINSIIKS